MPEYYSPWAEAASGMSQLGGSLQNIAVGLARQKYDQAMMQQQMQMKMMELQSQQSRDRQQGRLYDAQTALTRANEILAGQKVKDLERTAGAKDALGQAAWYGGMVQAGENAGVDMGPRGDIASAQMLSAMGQLPDAARSKFPLNVAQMFQMRDPRMQQLLATGTKATSSLPAGATLMDSFTGDPMYQSPRTLGQGQVMVPGEGGEPIASGMPPRASADPTLARLGALQKVLGSGQALIGNTVDPTLGPPKAGNPLMGPFTQGTNMVGQTSQMIAELLGQMQGQAVPQAEPTGNNAPQPGEVRKGYRFKGGNPADKNSWEKVQ
jgi:hypothetical protein